METPVPVPTAPKALPLLGHTLQLLRDPLPFLRELPQYGDLVRIEIGPTEMLVVCDPELTRRVLRDDRTFDKGGHVIDTVREVLGNGLSVCPHSAHRRQRRLTQPAFHHTRFPGYARTISAKVDQTTGTWHHGQLLDVFPEMLTLTNNILTGTIFPHPLPPQALRHALDDLATILVGMYRRATSPPTLNRLPTPGNRRFHRARLRLRHTLHDVIVDRDTGPADGTNLLSALLSARDLADDGNGAALSDAEVTDHVLAFWTAGSETAASTLAWAFYLLARHPDVADGLRTEVDTVLGGAPASHEHLPKLALTNRVLTETLRLYPSAWMITRIATADTLLGAHFIPAGTTLAFSPYLVHRRCDLYDKPDRFDPGRWIDAPSARNAYIPFGDGPRKCIGDQFAMVEMALALATITSRWKLETVDRRHVRPSPALTLRPLGLRMRVLSRAA